MCGRLVAIGANDMPGDELWRGEDDAFGSIRAKLAFTGPQGNDLDS